jgi:hypothetical protein
MNINPLIWYAERELKFIPRHFIKCPTTCSWAARTWIQNKITGRFAFAPADDKLSTSSDMAVFFEDEKDAMLYELIWASAPN